MKKRTLVTVEAIAFLLCLARTVASPGWPADPWITLSWMGEAALGAAIVCQLLGGRLTQWADSLDWKEGRR